MVHRHTADVRARLIQEATRIWAEHDDPAMSLEAAMRRLPGAFVGPMVQGGEMAPLLRIHLREMVGPTPIPRDVLERSVTPHYRRRVALPARHCGVAEPDDDLHRLAFPVTAMVDDYCMSREWMEARAPGLLSRPDALERALDSLVGCACALVRHECQRRQVLAAPSA